MPGGGIFAPPNPFATGEPIGVGPPPMLGAFNRPPPFNGPAPGQVLFGMDLNAMNGHRVELPANPGIMMPPNAVFAPVDNKRQRR